MSSVIRFLLILLTTAVQATDIKVNVEDLKKPLLGIGPQIPLEDVQETVSLLTSPKELKEFAKKKKYILEKVTFFDFIKSFSLDLDLSHVYKSNNAVNDVFNYQVVGKFQEATFSKFATIEGEKYTIVLLGKNTKIIESKYEKVYVQKSKNVKTIESYFLYKKGDRDKKRCYFDNVGRVFLAQKDKICKESMIPSEFRQMSSYLLDILKPKPLDVFLFSEIEKFINNTNNTNN